MDQIKCMSCGHTSDKPDDFLEFVGNVNVPGEGGIIGNNLAFGKERQIWEPETPGEYLGNRSTVFESEEFRLYSLVYCLKCTVRIIGDHIRFVRSNEVNIIKK